MIDRYFLLYDKEFHVHVRLPITQENFKPDEPFIFNSLVNELRRYSIRMLNHLYLEYEIHTQLLGKTLLGRHIFSHTDIMAIAENKNRFNRVQLEYMLKHKDQEMMYKIWAIMQGIDEEAAEGVLR